MKKVTGIGGIFFKSKDVPKLKDWYRDHLGFNTTEWGATMVWGDLDPEKKTLSRTEWSPFKADTTYFSPSEKPFMINYRVHDLRSLLAELKKEGVEIAGEMQEFEYGRFGWIVDPEKNKIELWEPVDDKLGDSPAAWTERVTGLGGIFFKCEDPKKQKEWYAKHLGIEEMTFKWKDLSDPDAKTEGQTVWSPFKKDTDYFNPSDKPYMFNYRVKDLAGLMKKLTDEGVQTVGKIDEYPYGNFGWILDLEGTKIELWEPKEG